MTATPRDPGNPRGSIAPLHDGTMPAHQTGKLAGSRARTSALLDTFAAKGAAPPQDVRFGRTSPVMRVFDEAEAREFYLGFLGFTLDWEHRFGPNFPLCAQVSRAGLTVHLSGHHGDASPGSTAFVVAYGVRRYQQELVRKDYAYAKPAL